MKNKKIFTVILISVALTAIIGGLLFISSTNKAYKSFPDIFKKMDVSTKYEKNNIEALKRFAEKNNYLFQKEKNENASTVSIISKDYIQNLTYSPEKNELWFMKMNSTKLTMPDEMKVKKIKKEDSFYKVIDELGEPDKMKKNKNGRTELRWEDSSEKGYVILSIELEGNKVTKIRNEEVEL